MRKSYQSKKVCSKSGNYNTDKADSVIIKTLLPYLKPLKSVFLNDIYLH